MKIVRLGERSTEKPAILYDDGLIRDVSIFLTEVDCSFVGVDWRHALGKLDPSTMPAVDPSARQAACLGSSRRIFATQRVGGDADASDRRLSLALLSGRVAGARDPLPLFASVRSSFRAGLAAVIRRCGGLEPEIGGLFLYTLVSPVLQDGAETPTWTAAASVDGLLSFGPWLADATDWDMLQSIEVHVTVNGTVLPRAGACLSFDEIRDAISRANTTAALMSGDVLLFGAYPAAGNAGPIVFLSLGDIAGIYAAGLGEQARMCVAAHGRHQIDSAESRR
jgi:hypothetical protein